MATICGVLLIAVFVGVGVFRGALRMVASLLVLFVAGLLARPLSPVGVGLCKLSGLVPLALLPIGGILMTGIWVFILLMIPVEIALRRREARRKEDGLTAREQWEAILGGALGGVWGLLLITLIFTGITVISGVQKSMRYANAEIDYRSDRRHRELLRVNQIARMTNTPPAPLDAHFENEPVEDKNLKVDPPSQGEELADQVQHSIFAPLVNRVDPVDDHAEKLLRDLTVVIGDPILYERFVAEPKVAELINEPKLQELSKDPEIAAAVRERRYRDLLNNPKLADTLEDDKLTAKLKALQIDSLLRRVRQQPDRVGEGLPAGE